MSPRTSAERQLAELSVDRASLRDDMDTWPHGSLADDPYGHSLFDECEPFDVCADEEDDDASE